MNSSGRLLTGLRVGCPNPVVGPVAATLRFFRQYLTAILGGRMGIGLNLDQVRPIRKIMTSRSYLFYRGTWGYPRFIHIECSTQHTGIYNRSLRLRCNAITKRSGELGLSSTSFPCLSAKPRFMAAPRLWRTDALLN